MNKLFFLLVLLGCCSCQRHVTESHQSLFDGKVLAPWKVSNFGTEGEVKVQDGELELGYGYPLTGVTWAGKDLPKNNYAIEFEAIKKEGVDFFVGLTFPVDENYCSLILGGWGGTTCGLSSFDYSDASDNETTTYMDFKLNRWYHVKMVVEGDRLQAYVDHKKIIDTEVKGRKVHIRPEVEPSMPLGLCSFETVAAYKNIKLYNL